MAAVGALEGQERQERLEGAIRSVRTRVGSVERTRLMLIWGGVLLGAGLLAILLGWYGAARTPYPVEQTPYLISGGILGLGMTMAGGALYVSYWLSQLVATTRREGAATRQAIAALGSVGAPDVAPTAGVARVVATATGTLFHRPDCQVMSGKRARTVSADDPKLSPCKVCNPLG